MSKFDSYNKQGMSQHELLLAYHDKILSMLDVILTGDPSSHSTTTMYQYLCIMHDFAEQAQELCKEIMRN